MSIFHYNSAIGLDISDLSLKACRLYKKRTNIYLDSVKSVRVPLGYIDKGRIVEKEKVAGLIKQVLYDLQKGRSRLKLINTTLPEIVTFVKLIEVEQDLSSNITLFDRVKKEVACHIPYAIEDVYLDWQKLGSDKTGSMIQILVAACPKPVVNEYIHTIHSAGFVPKSLEVEALPITRSIFPLQKENSRGLSGNKDVIIIDLGSTRSSLIFWREQRHSNIDTVEFSVSLPLVGVEINQILEKKLKLTAEQAEKFKIKCGLGGNKQCGRVIKKLIRPLLKQLSVRLRQSIEFHKTNLKGTNVDKILICGGGANLRGLDKFLSEELKIPVFYANPLTNVENKVKISRGNALSYTTAIGLALYDFVSKFTA